MNVNTGEFTIGIQTDLVTSASPNYRVPSWPPPRDWPVVINRHGVVVSRWGDRIWDLTPWAGRPLSLNFGDGEVVKGRRAPLLDAENAHVMRMVATWLIWGPHAAQRPRTAFSNFCRLRDVVALCSRNGISATKLMRFPKVFQQVPGAIASSNYEATITLLHRLYDARDVLGFTIVDPDGIRHLVAAAPDHEHVQTPYIPPRIWLYQVARLRECVMDFLVHQEQIEACFKFCLDAHIKRFGSLEAALVRDKAYSKGPFTQQRENPPDYQGPFAQVAARYGIAELLAKWVSDYQCDPTLGCLSTYFTVVTYAGLAYVANFTLQRNEEVASIRASCLIWEEDERLGRVPIICGETTKTDPDSDARWVTSPSVEVAIKALSSIARMRMTCDQVNPKIQPTAADQNDPYLFSAPTEPWASGKPRPYSVRTRLRSLGDLLKGPGVKLFDLEQLTITDVDLAIARRLTPNLKEEDGFAVGKVWPLAWHQYRRTTAVNMFASGDLSDSTMQQLLKHSSRLMPLYYGRNHGRLHLNQDAQRVVVMAMYEAHVAMVKVAVSSDRFVAASPERTEALMHLLSAKDLKELNAMAKKGTISFREHRLGGCMKAGVCEYGGIESVARCGGGDGGKPCTGGLFDRKKEPLVRADLRRVEEEIKLLPAGQPRYNALVAERRAMENYLNAIST